MPAISTDVERVYSRHILCPIYSVVISAYWAARRILHLHKGFYGYGTDHVLTRLPGKSKKRKILVPKQVINTALHQTLAKILVVPIFPALSTGVTGELRAA